MATVKILYDTEASHLEDYLERHREEKMLTTEQSCQLEGAAKEFADMQKTFGSQGNNSIHLIQSWSPGESKRLTKEQVHTMGIELASRFAPGHQFIVQTHDDEPHLHNHIMINPVSLETGIRIQNKLDNIPKVRKLNDDIARENGLSVLPPQEKLTRPGPNERVKRIEAYRGRSYILDLARKAQFARSHATNYDEYLGILNTFDIQARIEPKNITYFYPGKEHGKRGKNLDPDLDKPGLERKFAENRERLARSPELRNDLSVILNRFPSESAMFVRSGKQTDLVSRRREEPVTTPRAEILDRGLIPIEALQLAKTKNILEYCEREKIPLNQDASGKTVVKGRESLEITPYSWVNNKNSTRGNIIDFVANHRQVSLLHAVSLLTDNPKLLLLEQYAGKEHSQYRPFIIPEENPASRSDSIIALSSLIGGETRSNQFADLFKQQRVQVSSSKVIRFLSDKNKSDFTDYLPDSAGEYRQSKSSAQGVFYSRIKGFREIELYQDPRSLLIHRPDALSKEKKVQRGILALLEPNMEALHREIVGHKGLSKITLIGLPGAGADPETQAYFEELKASLNPFSIDVSLAWAPVSFGHSIEGNQGIDFGRSREISF
jgi:hypothetical protein